MGAVRADVIGIDIIERGAGRAIDELVIDLPDPELVDLLLAEIGEVEGVDVENIRPLAGPPPDPAVTALGVAHRVRSVGAGDPATAELRAGIVVEGAVALLGGEWAALVDPTSDRLVNSAGTDMPDPAWLVAFVRGAMADGMPVSLQELAVAPVDGSDHVLAVGRSASPLRGREREVLAGLAALL
jgi:hypothetical protein